MLLKRGQKGSLIDGDGNLFFPKINEKKLRKQQKGFKKVITEVEEFLSKNNFSKARIKELMEFKQNQEDLKNLEKIEKTKKHLEFLREEKAELNKYFKNKK